MLVTWCENSLPPPAIHPSRLRLVGQVSLDSRESLLSLRARSIIVDGESPQAKEPICQIRKARSARSANSQCMLNSPFAIMR